jgi:hypothetical protein
MTNENIQGPVQLVGRGHVRRSSYNYQPGEYHDLRNMVISPDGTLKQRPPFQAFRYSESNQLCYFIGHWNDVVIATYTQPFSGTNNHLFTYGFRDTETISAYLSQNTNPSTLVTELDTATASVAGTRNYKRVQLDGFFQYNNREYTIITYGFTTTDPGTYWALAVKEMVPGANQTRPENINNAGTVGAPIVIEDKTNVVWSTVQTRETPGPMVRSWSVHKDRLWIATKDTVYFSAATNPIDFTVPNGGFFRFSGKSINSIQTIGDNIYVIMDEEIRLITYSTDPNVDSSVVVVSGTVGGDGSCVYEDTVYVVKQETLYALNGLNVNKIMDLQLELKEFQNEYMNGSVNTAGRRFEFKVEAFDGALYVLPRAAVRPQLANMYPYQYIYSHVGSPLDTAGLFRIDLSNGSVSRFIYRDNYAPAEMYYVGYEDQFNQRRLFLRFAVNEAFNRVGFMGSNPRFWYGGVATASPPVNFDQQNRYYYLDLYSNAAGTALYVHPIKVFMRIMNFSPDNMHYMMKKFRSIIINGDFPKFWDGINYLDLTRIQVGVGAYSDDSVLSTNTIIDELITQYTPSALESKISAVEPRSYRFGANQRSKNITIIIKTDESLVPALVDLSNYKNDADLERKMLESNMEITDIRTLWSYIGRGPTNDPNDVS